MCKRTTTDPLMRRFLDRYGLHLLAIPRADVTVGDVYIQGGGRTAPVGQLRHLLEPPLTVPEQRRHEPMADVAGRMSHEVGFKAGVSLLEGFLLAIGVGEIIDKVTMSYKRRGTRALRFTFKEPLRDYVDVLALGAELDERNFDPGQAFQPGQYRFYIATAVARSRSLSVVASAEGSGGLEAAADIAKIAAGSVRVVIERSETGRVTYAGKQLLSFGVELYELSYDYDARRLRLKMPDGFVPVRGSTKVRPRRALIGDPEGEAFLPLG